MSRPGDYNANNISEFRRNHGRVGGYFEGAPLLLLNTIGRRSGRVHTTPVMYLKDGDRLLVFASKGGDDHHPDWYFNLKANPDFRIEIGDDTVDVHAEEVVGGERDVLYNRQATLYPRFGEYQQKTKRIIPVISLTGRKQVR
jgi:deazaflavin-dependent oxidoreductase (nitroreductase family)